GAVGELRVGLESDRVRVEQHHLEAERIERAAALGARVVELAGLTDDDRSGADHHHLLEVAADRHQDTGALAGLGLAADGRRARRRSITCSRNAANHGRESCGPGPASGWYR